MILPSPLVAAWFDRLGCTGRTVTAHHPASQLTNSPGDGAAIFPALIVHCLTVLPAHGRGAFVVEAMG